MSEDALQVSISKCVEWGGEERVGGDQPSFGLGFSIRKKNCVALVRSFPAVGFLGIGILLCQLSRILEEESSCIISFNRKNLSTLFG